MEEEHMNEECTPFEGLRQLLFGEMPYIGFRRAETTGYMRIACYSEGNEVVGEITIREYQEVFEPLCDGDQRLFMEDLLQACTRGSQQAIEGLHALAAIYWTGKTTGRHKEKWAPRGDDVALIEQFAAEITVVPSQKFAIYCTKNLPVLA